MTLAGPLLLAGACLLAPVPGRGRPPASDSRPPAVLHSFAAINDPLSHGAVGDGLLSLNEAIQLYNQTLQVAQLSPLEVGQLSGFGQDITWAAIDASAVPVVTVERDLDVIRDLPHGLFIEGRNGAAVVDFSGPGVTHGFRANCNFCHWRDVIVRGGPYGIDLQQTDASFGGVVIENVRFENQAQFGVRVTATAPSGYGRALLQHCEFANIPTAFLFDEQMADRTTLVGLFDTTISGCTTALEFLLGNGGTGSYLFERLTIDSAGTGLRLLRPNNGSRAVTVSSNYVRITAPDCLDVQGHPTGTSDLQLSMYDLRAGSGGSACRLGPAGSSVRGTLQDSKTSGALDVRVGGAAVPFSLANLRASNGPVTLSTSAGQSLQVVDCRFDGCNVTTTGSGTTFAHGCCFVGGSVQAAATAPIHASVCHFGIAPAGPVIQSGSVPAPQLGSFRLQPDDPAIGGSFALQADLPAGLIGVFVLGVATESPVGITPSLRVYLELGATYTFPGLFRLQQGLTVPIPNSYLLIDTAWVCQMAVLPDPGVQAPDLGAPPGHRFVLR